MDDYKNDIDKYLKGQLTPAQMHALEKKALSDPFLADALEGLGSLPTGELQKDLNDLQAGLNRRAAPSNTVWLWSRRIAAALLFLCISTFLILFISNRTANDNDNLALNKEEKLAPQKEDALPPVAADSTREQQQATTPEKDNEKEASRTGTEPMKRSPESRSGRAPAPPAAAADKDQKQMEREEVQPEASQDLSIAEAIAEEEKVASAGAADSGPSKITIEGDEKAEAFGKDDAEFAKRKAYGAARAKEALASLPVNRKIVRGKVTFSDDGTALPGVNVLVKDTNEGTVSDGQGNFQIAVEGEPTLQFSFIGFSTEEAPASDEELNIQLDADVSELSEVVVVGYNEDVGLQPSTPTVMELATPEGGRKAFKQYLEKNLQYPEQALKNEVEGKVTVQFTIGMTGQLSDFKVIRGVGFGCEEEVIRLIKQGPKWSPTKKNEAPVKDRVRVRMRFSLPKK